LALERAFGRALRLRPALRHRSGPGSAQGGI